MIRKVFAYITNQNKLLVFRHTDFPEAGIQVPAGTVKTDEDLATAVLREAQEETGLTDLVIESFLGEQIRNMADVGKDEIHHRHFFTCAAVASHPTNGNMQKPIQVRAVYLQFVSNSSGQSCLTRYRS